MGAHVLRQRWRNSQHSFGPWPPVAVNMRQVSLRVGSMPRPWYTKSRTCLSKLALRSRWQRSRRRVDEHGSHSRPAPVQRVAPQNFHDSARSSKQPRRTIQLDALLFWEAIDKLPDPIVRPTPPVDAASQPAISLVITTANALTLYPQEEARGETWHPLPVARLLRSRYERLALTSWECRKAGSGFLFGLVGRDHRRARRTYGT